MFRGDKLMELYVINDRKPSLDELQKMVGGYIEIVAEKYGKQLIANEEGNVLGLNINWVATKEYNDYFEKPGMILGDAVLLEKNARIS